MPNNNLKKIKPMFNIFKKRNNNLRNTSYANDNRDNGFTDPDDFPTDGLDNSGW